MGLIVTLIIGGVIGWLASLIMKTGAQDGYHRQYRRRDHWRRARVLGGRSARDRGRRLGGCLDHQHHRCRGPNRHPQGVEPLQVTPSTGILGVAPPTTSTQSSREPNWRTGDPVLGPPMPTAGRLAGPGGARHGSGGGSRIARGFSTRLRELGYSMLIGNINKTYPNGPPRRRARPVAGRDRVRSHVGWSLE